MDTISSRESNTSYLPWAGVIVGAIAFIFAIIAFMKVNSLKNEIADLKNLSARIDGIETQANQGSNALQVANDARSGLMKLGTDANTAFKQVSDQLTEMRERLGKVEAGRPVRAAATAAGATGAAGATAQPAVAGPDEYVVKAGDSSGTKIAAANGVSLAALMAVNPDVNWNKLHIGQKLKLPKK